MSPDSAPDAGMLVEVEVAATDMQGVINEFGVDTAGRHGAGLRADSGVFTNPAHPIRDSTFRYGGYRAFLDACGAAKRALWLKSGLAVVFGAFAVANVFEDPPGAAFAAKQATKEVALASAAYAVKQIACRHSQQ